MTNVVELPVVHRCKLCKEVKPISDFAPSEFTHHAYRCKICRNLMNKERYKRDRNRICAAKIAYNRKRRARGEYNSRIHKLAVLNRIRNKCKIEGIDFNLDIEDLNFPDLCPALGIKIIKGMGDNAATVDRIKPNLGYTKGNIQIISKLANQIKSSATYAQILAVGEFCRQCEEQK